MRYLTVSTLSRTLTCESPVAVFVSSRQDGWRVGNIGWSTQSNQIESGWRSKSTGPYPSLQNSARAADRESRKFWRIDSNRLKLGCRSNSTWPHLSLQELAHLNASQFGRDSENSARMVNRDGRRCGWIESVWSNQVGLLCWFDPIRPVSPNVSLSYLTKTE